MNDQDRKLVAQVLHDVGQTGAQGFAALVKWQFIDGLTVFVTCSAAVCLAVVLLIMLLRWKPEESYDDDFKHLARWGGIAACIGIAIATICNGVQPGLRDMLAPDGAAVAWIAAHK